MGKKNSSVPASVQAIKSGMKQANKTAKNPNKHMSSTGYKAGLKKEGSEGEE